MTAGKIVKAGEGEAYEQLWRFKHGSLTGGSFDFMVGDLPYLCGPPLHVHRAQDDTFFVLEGTLTVQIGDDVHDLKPGDFATAPPGIPHTFDNIYRDQPLLRVLNLMTPGGLDALFFDQGRKSDITLDTLRDRYGVTIVGPTLGMKLGLSFG
jgi:quercetin dioxygenase-like cupin family protein